MVSALGFIRWAMVCMNISEVKVYAMTSLLHEKLLIGATIIVSNTNKTHRTYDDQN